MTTELFKERVKEASKLLGSIIEDYAGLFENTLSPKCIGIISKYKDLSKRVSQIIELIDAREGSYKILTKLEEYTDQATGKVDYFGNKLTFSAVRLLSFQAYLGMTWAICDLVTFVTGQLICTDKVKKDVTITPKLWYNFIKDGKSIPGQSAEFFKELYSLPIIVSYSVRNLFLHDGAIIQGGDFFEGRGVANGFRVSDKGLEYVVKRVSDNNVLTSQTRVTEEWPWHRDNLLKLLEVCNKEIDEVLGSMIISAAVYSKKLSDCIFVRDKPD